MIKRQLILLGFKSSIYVAIFVFFFACFLGYASNLAIDTFIQKAVIAGCLLGMAFFVSIRMLVKYVPENIGVVEDKDSNDENKRDSGIKP